MNKPTEIDAVRHCLTADIPVLDAGRQAAARERALRPAPRTRGRRRAGRAWPLAFRIAPVGVVAALAVTVAIGLGGGGHSGVQGPFEVPSANAAMILNRAAAHLAAGGALRGAQARVLREDMLQLVGDQGKDGLTYYYVLPRTMESGFDALGNWFYQELPDGQPRFASPAAKAAYLRAVGPYAAVPPKPRLEQHYGANAPNPNFLNLSAHQVTTLPSDPTALKARLLAQAPSLARQGEPHDLVDVAARLLTFGPTPPAVQAALARLLATLPGVHRVGSVRIGHHLADLLSFHGGTRLAFDRRTGQMLEEIDVLPHRSSGYPGVHPGTVVDVIAFTARTAATIDAPITVPAGKPVDGPTAPATPAATPAPTTHPCRPPLPGYVTDVEIYAVHRARPSATVELQPIKADCEGHGRFGVQPVGTRHPARLSPTATIQIFSPGARQLQPATLGQLEYGLSHPAKSGRFDGAVFAIKTNRSGEITGLAELFNL